MNTHVMRQQTTETSDNLQKSEQTQINCKLN
jgi:hypothetical protein